jgi:hypothetical protein
MPSQAEEHVNYYLRSTVATVQRDAEELRKLILEEQGNQQAFIKSLEDYGRSIQDDMQQWVRIGGEEDRAERRLLLDRAKAQSQANRQARRAAGRASGVVSTAFDKTVERAAKATAGAGADAGISLARIIEKSSTEGGPSPAQYLASQLNAQGKFASALVSGQGFGAEAGGEDDEAKTAYSVGMLRALKEANRGLVSDAVLKDAISLITGVPAAVINEQTLSTMKTARTQQIETRSRGAGARAGDVISDELMRDGFALDDFMPALQAQNLVIREQETLRQIEQARQQRITDTEAEVEQRMLERVDPGRGIEFAGRGLIGAMQYGRQVRQQRQETEQYTQEVNQRSAENQQQEQYLASLSPNVRLLYQATGQGMSSYQKHGNNIPPGVNENLWTIGGQLNTMKKANGFTDNDDLVVKARAMVNQLEGAGDMTPQQRENMLRQALEFYTMQGTGDFPPPPTDQPELTPEEQQQAIADPDAARGIQQAKADTAPVVPPTPEEESQAAIPTEGRTDRNLGLARRDIDALSQMAMNKAVNSYQRAYEEITSNPRRARQTDDPSFPGGVGDPLVAAAKRRTNSLVNQLRSKGFSQAFINSIISKSESLAGAALPLLPSGRSLDNGAGAQRATAEQYRRIARLEGLETLLSAAVQQASDNPEENKTARQINLPTYLSNNPQEALNIRSQEMTEGFVRPVVEAAAGVPELEAPALAAADMFVPGMFINQAEEIIGQSTEGANAQEFDELLQQLAEREKSRQGQQRLDQGTQVLTERIGEL